ncbi:CAF1-domain-containing protein [Jaminaea rosea]|uniref:poly(A)-specific ribonuclease n=1 Tax=Jaminaea rosea TaxID=1569628 RepID=A0A316UMR1_9BASI|nr:CAF1-domain-containing protein [Jaminaea rosea]PWN26254.1 CAF1-domain-containing protein [Jaminaea rosea]
MANQIREVWAENLDVEMANIRDAVERYPYVAMDTEFPGIVARPIGTFKGSSDYHYQTLRCNVDLLKLIQLGITLCDADGNFPPDVCTWQFNFRFSVADDMCAPDSLELLNKAGLDFERHDKLGIDVEYFGEVLITSGLALFPEVKWVSFHSGYDFGYLVKVVSCAPLPSTESDFFSLLRVWFPTIYDIKYLMRSCKTLKGGLQDVAEELGVARIGQQHQAGSDSLLTAATFFKLRSRFFDGVIDDSKFVGALYGFSASSRPNAVAGVGSGASAAALTDSTINGGSGAVVTR